MWSLTVLATIQPRLQALLASSRGLPCFDR
jgi:hypothetical protein